MFKRDLRIRRKPRAEDPAFQSERPHHASERDVCGFKNLHQLARQPIRHPPELSFRDDAIAGEQLDAPVAENLGVSDGKPIRGRWWLRVR